MPYVDSVKCLGITLDKPLIFNKYIDNVIRNVYFGLRRIYSSNIYFPHKIRKTIAKSLLLP